MDINDILCNLSHKRKPNWRKATRQKLFGEILAAYGGKCACPGCPETNSKFLTVDHKNGGGTKDRKAKGGSLKVYQAIVEAGFPSDYQLLCWNCNCGRAKNGGVCPHQEVSMECAGP